MNKTIAKTRANLVALVICVLLGGTTAEAANKITYQLIDGDGGVPLMVAESGDREAPSILFVHGFSLTSRIWKEQLEDGDLQRYHMAAVDLRGHGASGKPWQPESYAGTEVWANDIAAVIDALGLDKPVLVGWSFGGFVIMNYVRHYGTEDISGIGFVGSLGGLVPRAAAESELDESYRDAQDKQISLNLEDNIEGQRSFVELMTATPASERDTQLMLVSSLQLPVYVRRAMQGLALDNTDLMDKVKTPLLIAAGEKDFSVTPLAAKGVAEQLTDAHYLVYEGAGHTPFLESTAEFNKDLLAFVERVSP